MTTYGKGPQPDPSCSYDGFDHLGIWCSNAKQVADWFCIRFGYRRVAYRGLETGSRKYATHVIQSGDPTKAMACMTHFSVSQEADADKDPRGSWITLTSPYNPEKTALGDQIAVMGDFVKDVAFRVKDCRAVFEYAKSRGAKVIAEPKKLEDENGHIWVATIATYGRTVHTFVERHNYKGPFMPGYAAVEREDPIQQLLPPVELRFLDHIVGNQADGQMEVQAKAYEEKLGFHRFWSVDETQVHTEYSALRSVVMADWDENVKMPINEPAPSAIRKSQIQEYVDYHGDAGVQHVAIATPDIIKTVTAMTQRGVVFLDIPKQYYVNLRERLKHAPFEVKEDLDVIEKLKILVDFDDKGYLLQLFTKPVQDRPTLFFEVIQRQNNNGFGAGNFQALFESIERDQAKRGNLVEQ